MYESRTESPLHHRKFLGRLLVHLGAAAGLLALSLAGGMAGTAPLTVDALDALRAACGSNDLASFPFEFRSCGAEELDGQALAYAEAAADPSKHELITAVLDLVPVAADRLVQRQRAQP